MGIMFDTMKDPGDVMDMALDAGALFVPQVVPLTLPNGTVPTEVGGTHDGEASFNTIYRDTHDGEQILLNAAVRPGYHAASYAQLFKTADTMFPGTCVGLRLVDQGRKVVFTQQVGDSRDLGGGDFVSNYLMYTGSLDSTWASACYGFAFRPFCSNQIPMGLLQMSQKRTANHDALLFKKATILAKAAGVFDAFVGDASMLRGIELTTRTYRNLRDSVLPDVAEDAHGKTVAFADNRIAAIDYFWQDEVEKVGSNAWALFNAFQSYEFHTATKQDSDKQVEVLRQPEKKQTLTNAVRELVLA